MGPSPAFTSEETEAQRSNSLSRGHCDFVPGLSAKEPCWEPPQVALGLRVPSTAPWPAPPLRTGEAE